MRPQTMATAGRARVVSFVRCVSCVSSVSISTPKKEIFKTEIMFSRSRICSRNFKSHFLWLKNLLTQRGLVLTGANCKMHMSYGTRKKVEVFLTIVVYVLRETTVTVTSHNRVVEL